MENQEGQKSSQENAQEDTIERTGKQVFLRLPVGDKFDFGQRLSNLEIEIQPMGYRSQLLFLQKLGEMMKDVLKNKSESGKAEELTLSTVLDEFKNLVVGNLDFQFASKLPDLVEIIVDSYEWPEATKPTHANLQEMNASKMIELILRQLNTDRAESSVAENFFKSMLSKIPGVQAVTNLLSVTSSVLDSVSLAKFTLLNSSAPATTSSPVTSTTN